MSRIVVTVLSAAAAATLACGGAQSTGDATAQNPAPSSPGLDLTRQYPEVEAEINTWMAELDQVARAHDVEGLATFHSYTKLFSRIEPGMARMDQLSGREREDGYFGMLDRFEHSFTDMKIDVLSDNVAIASVRYVFQGFKDGNALHEPNNVWLTLVIAKDASDNRWKIIHESLVPTEQESGEDAESVQMQ